MKILISFYYNLGTSTALLLRFYCALAVSAMIRVVLTKIMNRSGFAIQWKGGFSFSIPLDGNSLTLMAIIDFL